MVYKKFLSYSLGLIFFATALYLMVSFACFQEHAYSVTFDVSHAEKSWLYYRQAGAALLIYFFGISGIFFVPLLVLLSFLLLPIFTIKNSYKRCVGLFGLLLVSAALCTTYGVDYYGAYPGGYIGLGITQWLSRWLSVYQKDLFFVVFLTGILLLIIPFSWVSYMPVEQLTTMLTRVYAQFIFYWRRFFSAIKNFVVSIITLPTNNKLSLEEEFEKLMQELESRENNQDTIYDSDGLDLSEEFKKIDNVTFREITQDRANLTAQVSEITEEPYVLPSQTLFTVSKTTDEKKLYEHEQERAHILEDKLRRFGVQGKIVSILTGPVVTVFEFQPHMDAKISTILAREDDLALALQALSLRIIAPIPGKSVVGFEVANTHRKSVLIGDIITSNAFKNSSAALPLILGHDTIGAPVIADLAAMPHLLVAGSTGAGKSVALNTMINSLLAKCTPDDLTIILVDPKKLEFSSFAHIPHLIFPIITDPKNAVAALRWAIRTMEERYELMAKVGARTILEYRTRSGNSMPYIAIVIDELADLMMTSGKEIEEYIARLSQMARAAGIHLIIATQRPSVDVITGVIKVNFPSRIAFKVTSKIDSRTILDCAGAEKLLGKGDMLFLDPQGVLRRIHGAYISDSEISGVTDHVRQQRTVFYEELPVNIPLSTTTETDALYDEVVLFAQEREDISISLVQRRFKIGYNRAARIIEMLEAHGVIAPASGSKMRKIIRST